MLTKETTAARKSVFVTGSSGLLGSNLLYLLRDKYTVCGIDRNELHMDGVETICASVLDFSNLEKLILERKPDYVLHCAALTRMDECEQNPEEAFLCNTTLTQRIADTCNSIGSKMIFISSDAVFSGNLTRLATEEDTVAPISVYGKSKALAEEYVLRYSNALALRTNIYGFNRREKNSFGEWVYVSLRDGHELYMFDDLFFSPILVNEFIDIIEMCMEQDLSGIYHAGGTGSISKYAMGMQIKDVFSLPGNVFPCSMDEHHFIAPRTRNMGLDNSKLKERLHINIRTPSESVDAFAQLMEQGYPQRLKYSR